MMTIDILAYELKYKNDPAVLDLLAAYKESMESQPGYDDLAGQLDDEQGSVTELRESAKEAKERLEDGIKEITATIVKYDAGKLSAPDLRDFVEDILKDQFSDALGELF